MNTVTQPNPTSGRRKLPRWKKGLFAITAVALFFVLLEFILAAFGVHSILYEEDPFVGFSPNRIPLFVEARGKDGSVTMVTARNKLQFFNAQQFPREKLKDTSRIFCVGGSTTFGRPYGNETSFAGWLSVILPEADPGRRWEVINAGGISYASYRVSLLIEELIKYQPDLFVIYSGQNEFLERRTYPTLLDRSTFVREVQAFVNGTRIWAALTRLTEKDEILSSPDAGRTLMPNEVETLLGESVGLEAYSRDDTLTNQVLEHYRLNLRRMVDIARSVGAEVIMVTPAVNLGACSPFKSEHRAELTPLQRGEFRRHYSTAEAKHKAANHAEALRSIDEAMKIDSRVAHLHYLHGRTLRAMGRTAESRAAFLKAVDEDVCPLRALTQMTKIVTDVATKKDVTLVDFDALVRQQAADGIADDRQFLDHVHPTIEMNRQLALAILDAMQSREIATASASWNKQALQRIVERVEGQLDPLEHARALHNLAKVLNWAGKSDEAERLALQAVELAPEAAPMHHELGVVLERRGRYEESEQSYRRALQLAPDLAPAHASLGVLLSRTKRPERAVEHFRLALEKEPKNISVLNSLGIALAQLKRFDEARGAYQDALAFQPESHIALTNLGHLFFEQNLVAEAKVSYERALAVEPRVAEAHYKLGLLALRVGQAPAAEQRFRMALGVRPHYIDAHIQLGQLYEALGKDAQAIHHYEMALLRNHNLAEAHNNLGILYAKQGNLTIAAKHFRRSFAINPNDDRVRKNLQRAEELLKRPKNP